MIKGLRKIRNLAKLDKGSMTGTYKKPIENIILKSKTLKAFLS